MCVQAELWRRYSETKGWKTQFWQTTFHIMYLYTCILRVWLCSLTLCLPGKIFRFVCFYIFLILIISHGKPLLCCVWDSPSQACEHTTLARMVWHNVLLTEQTPRLLGHLHLLPTPVSPCRCAGGGSRAGSGLGSFRAHNTTTAPHWYRM